MIRRIVLSNRWIELEDTPQGLRVATEYDKKGWITAVYKTAESWIIDYIKDGWKEVTNTATIDPNDAQGFCDHRKWDAATDTCAICGKNWETIMWSGSKPCCGGSSGNGPHYYTNGKWHQSDCDSLKPPTSLPVGASQEPDYRPKPNGFRCECGAQATSNPNAHAFYCPEYKK
jgi:hypothetical protein